MPASLLDSFGQVMSDVHERGVLGRRRDVILLLREPGIRCLQALRC